MRLRRADYEAVLSFLVDVSELELHEPYPVELFTRLQSLVPCDELIYQDVDPSEQRFWAIAGIGPDGDDDEEERYWAAGPCPISDHRVRTHDLAAVRMSDIISPRRYHELPIFREYFGPAGVDSILDVGLTVASQRFRSFVFFRRRGARDFSDRDRAVLDVLRPHFSVLEERPVRRLRLSGAMRSLDPGQATVAGGLTAREREIVQLVAEGKTNAQIAAQLWVAPSTVKKHLEHVYEKLGVGRRTAAATFLQAAELSALGTTQRIPTGAASARIGD
ncbi:MAG: helix-turn-helix transcriptional regulator [Candidatus Limnocylindria bacterium]